MLTDIVCNRISLALVLRVLMPYRLKNLHKINSKINVANFKLELSLTGKIKLFIHPYFRDILFYWTNNILQKYVCLCGVCFKYVCFAIKSVCFALWYHEQCMSNINMYKAASNFHPLGNFVSVYIFRCKRLIFSSMSVMEVFWLKQLYCHIDWRQCSC